MFRTRHRSPYARLTVMLYALTRRGAQRQLDHALRAQARDMVSRGYDYPPILCGRIITFGTVTEN